jgi:hypothetical protein
MVQDIIVILDESSSMKVMGSEPVDAVNSFIEDQRITQDGATFSLWKFNSKSFCVIDDILLDNVSPVEDYQPIDKTALYDTVCCAIKNKLGKGKFKNVICLIITDGEDNCSKNYNLQETNKLVHDTTDEHGWTFIYLGTNQDAMNVGSDLDFRHCASFENCSGHLISLTRQTSSAIIKFREDSSECLDACFSLGDLPMIGSCFRPSVIGLSRQPSSWNVGNL